MAKIELPTISKARNTLTTLMSMVLRFFFLTRVVTISLLLVPNSVCSIGSKHFVVKRDLLCFRLEISTIYCGQMQLVYNLWRIYA